MINKINNSLLLRFTLIAFIVIFSFYSSIAYAQDCIRARPIFTGELSKCDGILYPESLVKEHLLLQVKTEELSQKLKVNKETCNKKITACEKYIIQADKRIDKLNNPPFWKTPSFNFFSCVLVSVTSVLVLSFTIN